MAGILSDVTGAGEVVTGVGKIAGTVEDTLFRLFPQLDKGEAAKAAQQIEMTLLQQQGTEDQGQIEINKTEASSGNWFVSGARPAIIWLCGFGLLWAAVLQPIIACVCALAHYSFQAPAIQSDLLTTLLFGLLGLGGYHSLDKYLGTATDVTTVATNTKQPIKAVEVRKALPVK